MAPAPCYVVFFSYGKGKEISLVLYAVSPPIWMVVPKAELLTFLSSTNYCAARPPPSAKVTYEPDLPSLHLSAWSSFHVQKYPDRQGIAPLGRERSLCLQISILLHVFWQLNKKIQLGVVSHLGWEGLARLEAQSSSLPPLSTMYHSTWCAWLCPSGGLQYCVYAGRNVILKGLVCPIKLQFHSLEIQCFKKS